MEMRRCLINVSNVFGDFANGQELLEHYTRIFGWHDGFFHAWRLHDEAMDFLEEDHCTREEFPEVFEFADSLFEALEMAEI